MEVPDPSKVLGALAEFARGRGFRIGSSCQSDLQLWQRAWLSTSNSISSLRLPITFPFMAAQDKMRSPRTLFPLFLFLTRISKIHNMPITPSTLFCALICITYVATTASAKNIMVTNLDDAGPGSLRDAVASANEKSGRDTIRFPKSLQGTITLTSGEIEISDKLVIEGPGASRLTVSGGNTSRIFKIGHAVEVSIEELTIADGRNTTQDILSITVTRGGAILNDGGSLRLSGVTMCNNETINSTNSHVVGGGAVVNSGYATLFATNCQFIDNIARGGTSYAFGGAIGSVTESVAIIEHCTFSGNLATSGGTSYGGAIGNFGGSELTVIDCTFSENRAKGENANEKAFGGAIAARPGTVDNSGSVTAIQGCLLVCNLALGAADETGNGANAGGGALYNFNSTLMLDKSTLAGNQTEGGTGIYGGDAYGGALYATGTQPLAQPVMIRHCHFFANSAVGNVNGDALGGALHNDMYCQMGLRQSSVTHNWAWACEAEGGEGIGGGLYNLGDVTVDKKTYQNIVGNEASTSDDNIFGTVTSQETGAALFVR